MLTAGKRPVALAATGWHFQKEEFHYYIGAQDQDTAIKILSKKDAKFADVVPKRMAVAVMRFFELRDGKVMTGVDVTYRKK